MRSLDWGWEFSIWGTVSVASKAETNKYSAKTAEYFTSSVPSDDMQDVSRKEQPIICVHNVEVQDFLGVVPIEDVKAPGLVSVIILTLSRLYVDLEKMVTQGYDRAAVGSGKCKGV